MKTAQIHIFAKNYLYFMYGTTLAQNFRKFNRLTLSERFVKDIMKDIKKCPKIQCFQALQQEIYSVLFHALHIVFYQSDNFVVHAFPALSAVME